MKSIEVAQLKMADLLEEERSMMGSSLAAAIQRSLNSSPQYSSRRCIFKVPNQLRQTDEQAYTPVLVSIGPLHHNSEKLLPMEVHKLKYLSSFLKNFENKVHKDVCGQMDMLNYCLSIVKGKETEIRECYADPIYLSSDDFAKMVLIDSVFIIQLFNRIPTEDDYMYNKPFLRDTVLRDIKLEENQLPFFILDEIYHAAFQTTPSSSNSVPSFTQIACKGLGFNLDVNTKIRPMKYYHLLHLFACHLRQHTSESKIPTTDAVEGVILSKDLVFPPATQLYEAGVKFQVINDSSSLLNIEFDKEKGILKIPKLYVDDNTEDLWRNLVAFEQCNRPEEHCYFTDYQFFLDCLIYTPKDAQLLAEAGIIQNLMGSHEQVSYLINSLGTYVGTSGKGYYYEKISLELIRHCKKGWNRYRATLMHKYFNHPWAVMSVFYAIILLLLTIAQVVAGLMAIPQLAS